MLTILYENIFSFQDPQHLEQANPGKPWAPTSLFNKKLLGPVQKCMCLTSFLKLIRPITLIRPFINFPHCVKTVISVLFFAENKEKVPEELHAQPEKIKDTEEEAQGVVSRDQCSKDKTRSR